MTKVYESTGEVREPKCGELYLNSRSLPCFPKKVAKALGDLDWKEVIMRDITEVLK
jgi:hypothetical protein